MFDKGFFGGLFDFNGDGKLDTFERAADTAAFMSLMEETTKTEDASVSDDYDEDDFESDELEELTGYSRDDLEFMDHDERAEILENAGYDADDFDFDDDF